MGRLYSQRDEFGYLASDDKLQKRLHDNGRDMLNPQKRHLHHSLYQQSLNRFFYGISPLLHKLLMKSSVTQEG